MEKYTFNNGDILGGLLAKVKEMSNKMDIESKLSRLLGAKEAANYLTREAPQFKTGDELAWVPGLKYASMPKYGEKVVFYKWLYNHEAQHDCNDSDCVAKHNPDDCLCIVSLGPTYVIAPFQSRRFGPYEDMLKLTSEMMEKVGESKAHEDKED